ncbi:MAG: hypothetical protein AAGG48_24960 [Planctomycetota bacterium]
MCDGVVTGVPVMTVDQAARLCEFRLEDQRDALSVFIGASVPRAAEQL